MTWVDLGPLVNAALAPLSVAQAIGLTPVPGRDIESQLVAALQTAAPLLILDNCEHVLEQVATLVASWIAVCPDLQVLATSRAPLRLRGERDLPVEPLPLPDAQATVDALLQNDAVRLFAEPRQSAYAARNPGLAMVVATVNHAAPLVIAAILAYLLIAALTMLPYILWRRRFSRRQASRTIRLGGRR